MKRKLTRFAAGLLAVPVLVLAGCARAPEPALAVPMVGEATAPADAEALLAQFADFPVERTPRPILLFSGRVMEYGYTSGDAKIAVSLGRLALRAELPDSPATVRATLHDGAFELPAISARQAYDMLLAVGDPKSAPDANPAPLAITKVTLGEAEFSTDRGLRKLPAWLFTAAESFQPIAVLALADTAFWPAERMKGAMGPAGLAADGVTLTVRLTTPGPPCPGRLANQYEAEVVESAKAALVRLRIVATPPAASPGTPEGCARFAKLYTEEFTVRLAQPLGNRVLLHTSEHPS
ncbi:hypothetical protein [Catellatospora vulcania]|uniref:hypothetical protein n=1 Tax=Catellatospora vulcania TaxID=1460450 RepID=UPI0012D4A576|nr:hypothetical protein [Catellatospora vulcania]